MNRFCLCSESCLRLSEINWFELRKKHFREILRHFRCIVEVGNGDESRIFRKLACVKLNDVSQMLTGKVIEVKCGHFSVNKVENGNGLIHKYEKTIVRPFLSNHEWSTSAREEAGYRKFQKSEWVCKAVCSTLFLQSFSLFREWFFRATFNLMQFRLSDEIERKITSQHKKPKRFFFWKLMNLFWNFLIVIYLFYLKEKN